MRRELCFILNHELFRSDIVKIFMRVCIYAVVALLEDIFHIILIILLTTCGTTQESFIRSDQEKEGGWTSQR